MASRLFALECNETVTLDENGEVEGSVLDGLEYLWLVGVGTSVFSSLATALGTILQKKAHSVQEELPDEEKAFEFIGIVFNRYWLFALFIMVLVPLPFDFASFALAPQSVIVPLSGLTIVCSLILSYYMLGESITRIHVIGTSIILTGVVITSVTGGGNPPQFTVCELIGRYSDPDVLVAATFVASIITVNMYWIWTRRHWKSVERLRVLMYAVVAGSLGSGVNVGFKATGELTKGSVGSTKTNTFATLWPYLHIVGVGILAIGMISTINRGLQQYDAAIFTPLYFTSLIVMSSTVGLIFYREYSSWETWQYVLFPMGIMIVCGGVLFIAINAVDVDEVRNRVARLEKSRANRRSMAASSRASRSSSRKLNSVSDSRYDTLREGINSLRFTRPLSQSSQGSQPRRPRPRTLDVEISEAILVAGPAPPASPESPESPQDAPAAAAQAQAQRQRTISIDEIKVQSDAEVEL